jgi:uncharacterized protein with FMN-binding domain
MSDLVELNVHHAGVPRKYIHSESFAFSPEAPRGRRTILTPTRLRVSIIAVFVAIVGAVIARFAWFGTQSTTTVPAAAGIPTVKPTPVPTAPPTAIAAVQRVTATPKPTRVAKPTAVATARPTAVQYAGQVISTQYGTVQVTIAVKGKTITAVTVASSPDSQRSQIVDTQAAPTLKSETLQAQSANINTVSGATPFSQGYIQSLQSALSKAGL